MKENGVVCSPGPALFFFIFRFECVFSARKVTETFEKRAPRQNKMETNSHTPKGASGEKAKTCHFPILDLVEEGPLNFTSIFSKTGNEIGDAKRQAYQACPSFKGLGLLNYRIQGTFSKYIRWGGSVARQSLLTSPRATKPRLKSHKASCRAPKILPFSFFKMLTSTDQPSSH